MRMVGSNANSRVVGLGELPGRSNYFLGNDPTKWRTNVPTCARVSYQSVFPGIDLVYYGNQSGQLEYDFVVEPGANPSSILLAIDAAGGGVSNENDADTVKPTIDSSGDLVVYQDGPDAVRFRKPVVYQVQRPVANGKWSVPEESRRFVDGHFVLLANDRIGFAVPAYDRTRPLVIDPVLVYSTYLGSNGTAVGIAVDSSGSAYVTGATSSAEFPTVNPIQGSLEGSSNAIVAKFNPEGSALVYSTYLGGNGSDGVKGIAIDGSGDAIVAGATNSFDFPTVNPFQATKKTSIYDPTAFVAKLNASGSALVYSTYLGGSALDVANAIAADASGNAYVTGVTESYDFPTQNPLGPNQGGGNRAFITKLNPTGSALVYSTQFGGSNGYIGTGIAVDSSGNLYVTGIAASPGLPIVNAIQPNLGAPDAQNAFLAKVNPEGSALVYSTYLGGSGSDQPNGVAVDSSGNVYLTGITWSPDFPMVNPVDSSYEGNGISPTAFVAKLNAAGSTLVYSTYLGGNGGDWGMSIVADSSGNAYVTGGTASANFPIVNPIDGALAGPGSGFVTELNPSGSAFVYSSPLGDAGGTSIVQDSSGNVYVTGGAGSGFPTANPMQASSPGGPFVAKIAASGPSGPALTLSALNLNFGNVPPGVTSSVQTVILRSIGADSLTITSIVLGGDFAFAPIGTSCPLTGGTLASGADCTIEVTFTPTTAGASTGSVMINDNANDSPQSVSLVGTGVASAAVAAVSPASLSFGPQWVDSASTAQPVTLSNVGNAPLVIRSIGLGGNYTQSNNCGNSVAAGSSCTINVSFAPGTGGPIPETLVITDNSNAVNNTQTVGLSGTGQDFMMTMVVGPSTSFTLSPGQTVTYTWAVTARGGFNNAVNFGCSIDAPEASCTASPNMLTPSSTPTNFNITVTTTAPSASAPRPLPPFWPRLPWPNVVLMFAALLAGAAWNARRGNQVREWRLRTAGVLIATGLMLVAVAGCGGGTVGLGGGGDHPNSGTPVGNYVITTTATASSGSSSMKQIWDNGLTVK